MSMPLNHNQRICFQAKLTGLAAKAVVEKTDELKTKKKFGKIGKSRVTEIILSECKRLGLSDQLSIHNPEDNFSDDKLTFDCIIEGEAASAIEDKIKFMKNTFNLDKYGKNKATQVLLCEYYKMKHGK